MFTMFTVEDLINVLNEFNPETIVEEIIINEDGVSVITEQSYSAFTTDFIKTLQEWHNEN